MNLYCPTLFDFRWCKDAFLSKLFSLENCDFEFWKEKFIFSVVFYAKNQKGAHNIKLFQERHGNLSIFSWSLAFAVVLLL